MTRVGSRSRALARRTGTRVAARLTSDAVVGTRAGLLVWRALLSAGVLPPRSRIRWAGRVGQRLAATGRPEQAHRLLERTATSVTSASGQAELAGSAALLRLGLADPPVDLGGRIEALAAAADRELAAGRPSAAVGPLNLAAGLAFHRTLHFDSMSSPLADDPEGFLGPLHRSAAWARLGRSSGRSRPAGDRAGREPEREPGRGHRLLFLSYKNWKFADPLVEHYRELPGVQVRRVDLGDVPAGTLPLSPLQQIRLRMTGTDDHSAAAWAAAVRPHLDWADTVFVDWLQRGAVLVSALDPGSVRVVMRLHSFEAFTAFPHLIDYSRVDHLVVVGAHLGRLLHRAVPASARCDLRVLPNAMQLRRFGAEKPAEARFTLAVLGYNVVAKDPLWAVEVLARLRRDEPRYRLLLIGHPFPDGPDVASGLADYHRRLTSRISEPDVAGAVELRPFTPDVPTLLREVGVGVSSSVRESFHQALVELAASGAVPVVRDWPFFAATGGPSGLFPDEWITPSVEEAANRIRRLTSDEATWRRAGVAARQEALARYDWEVTRPRFDELLLGSAGPAGSAGSASSSS